MYSGPWRVRGRCRRAWQWLVAFGLAMATYSGSASRLGAEDYPTRTVKIIVPFPAGGTADVLPRIIGERLARKWGKAVVIENKPGAAGNIGAEAFARADPDGYTLLSAPPPPLVINQNLYRNLAFDPTKFVPVTIIAGVPNALLVAPKFPANSVAEVIAYARANPGKVTSGTQGNGSTSHLTSEMFQMMANVKFVHIPYRGSAPALQGLLAGDVDVMFDNLGVSLALAKSGQLKLLAVATEKRMASLPDVPTIAETLPGFLAAAWYGVVAPQGTAQSIVEKLNTDIAQVLRQPDVAAQLLELSAEPMGDSTQATAAYMRAEVERWNRVIQATGIKVD